MSTESERRARVVHDYLALFNDPPGDITSLRGLVTEDVRFRDPFNDLRGVERLQALLDDFARRVDSPRFEVLCRAWDSDTCLLRWRMSGRVAVLGDWRVEGVSELIFAADDRINEHIDHWDAAGQFYERLPLLGRLLKLLRKRVAAPG